MGGAGATATGAGATATGAIGAAAPPAGTTRRLAAEASPWAIASFSAAIASGARGLPLLTPLQSLKAPACQLASGWQYPYSEQQGAEAGHPRGHFTARALKGAAAQLPSPVPAPRSPAWQLAAERMTTATLDHMVGRRLESDSPCTLR